MTSNRKLHLPSGGQQLKSRFHLLALTEWFEVCLRIAVQETARGGVGVYTQNLGLLLSENLHSRLPLTLLLSRALIIQALDFY